MFGKYPLAEVGALLAEPSRVAMLTVLLDGFRHSAGELAMVAGLSPQAASAHLAKLTDGGLLRATRVGRRRLFEFARPEVGQAVESLGAVARTGASSRSAAKASRRLAPVSVAPPSFAAPRSSPLRRNSLRTCPYISARGAHIVGSRR
jgi:DNA-binding transcriptional ArsR family regulator